MSDALSTIEEGVPLSRSRLWDWQAQFFRQTGVTAWAGTVPFYVTSNPVIAYSYASILARYLQDLARLPTGDGTAYIVELGAGSGKFSFYCLRHLARLCESLRLPFKPCYVMTDFAQANLDFWQSQPQLRPFIDAGLLDFARFDIDDPAPLQLVNSGRTVSPAAPGRAVLAIANYVFDSTRHDVFQVRDQALLEGLVRLQAPPGEAAPALPEVRCSFTLRPTDPASYYPSAHWNAVLADYCREECLDGHFVFPTAMFRALDFLEQLGGGRLLLLSSDKGYTSVRQIEGREPPALKLHGSCFSLAVNFDAVRRYVAVKGGLGFHQPAGSGLRTCAYVLGDAPAALPETATAIRYFVQQCSSYDYWQVDQQLRSFPSLSLPACIAHLRCGHWDPHLVSAHLGRLLAGLKDAQGADSPSREALYEGLALAEQQIYVMPGMSDSYFDLASLYDALGDPRSAIRLLRSSAERFPRCFATHFNLGLSYYKAGEVLAAYMAFERAGELEGDGRTAEEWRAQLFPQVRHRLPRIPGAAGRRLTT